MLNVGILFESEWILVLTLAAGSYTSDPACDNQHPKHSCRRGSACSGGQHNADNQKGRGGHGARFTTQLVDDDAKEQHSEDHADEESVAQSIVYGIGQGLRVQDGQEKLHVADDRGIAGQVTGPSVSFRPAGCRIKELTSHRSRLLGQRTAP